MASPDPRFQRDSGVTPRKNAVTLLQENWQSPTHRYLVSNTRRDGNRDEGFQDSDAEPQYASMSLRTSSRVGPVSSSRSSHLVPRLSSSDGTESYAGSSRTPAFDLSLSRYAFPRPRHTPQIFDGYLNASSEPVITRETHRFAIGSPDKPEQECRRVLKKIMVQCKEKLEAFVVPGHGLLSDEVKSWLRVGDATFVPRGSARKVFTSGMVQKLFSALDDLQRCRNPYGHGRTMTPGDLVDRINGIDSNRSRCVILATLVYMECEPWTLEDFLQALNSEHFTDRTLPFRKDEAEHYFRDAEEIGVFCAIQHIFSPIILRQGEVTSWAPGRRLPVLASRYRGKGEYSTVIQMTLAAGALEYWNGNCNNESTILIMKIYKTSQLTGTTKESAFMTELDAHVRLANNELAQDSLVEFIGAVERSGFATRSNAYGILLEPGRGSLEHLLNGPAPQIGMHVLIFKRLGHLWRALGFIHEHRSPGGKVTPCVHGDIKPDNILIFLDLWKFCDWGLCQFLSEGAEPPNHPGGDSPYGSPEAINSGKVSTASDTWSLAVVTIEVLIHIIGGPQLLEKFRMHPEVVNHNMFFYRNGSSKHPQLKTWYETIKKTAGEKYEETGYEELTKVFSFTLEYLTSKILIPEVSEREKTSAGDVGLFFNEMSRRLQMLPRQTPRHLEYRRARVW